MKRPLLMAGIAMLLSANPLIAQINLNWASSFLPLWLNGNTSGIASNIGGYSINCNTNVTINGPGSFVQAMGSYGSMTPSVSGAVFTVPGTNNRIQFTPNFANNSSYANIILSFSAMTTNVTFRIVDIDKSDAFSDTYFDRVTITGTNGSSTYNPTISKYDPTTDPNFLIISGNTAYVNPTSGQGGNTNSDASDQRGTVTVSFGSAVINSITIRYDNAPGTDNNPAAQSIAIGSVSFNQSTLPVHLTRFDGHRQSADVLLDWTTQQEFNAASFDIERTNGSNSWEKIGSITATGNSNTEVDYHFRDLNPQGSLLLYRLKQIDIDNNYKYSSVVRITTKNAASDLQAYPNPFREQVNISIYSPVAQQASFSLVDAIGRTLKTETRKLFAGENSIMLSQFAEMPKGIYYIIAYDTNADPMGRTKIFKE